MLSSAQKEELRRPVTEEDIARVITFTDEKLQGFEANYQKQLERQGKKEDEMEHNFETHKAMIRIRDEITLKHGYSYEHQEKIFDTGNALVLEEEAK